MSTGPELEESRRVTLAACALVACCQVAFGVIDLSLFGPVAARWTSGCDRACPVRNAIVPANPRLRSHACTSMPLGAPGPRLTSTSAVSHRSASLSSLWASSREWATTQVAPAELRSSRSTSARSWSSSTMRTRALLLTSPRGAGLANVAHPRRRAPGVAPRHTVIRGCPTSARSLRSLPCASAALAPVRDLRERALLLAQDAGLRSEAGTVPSRSVKPYSRASSATTKAWPVFSITFGSAASTASPRSRSGPGS